MIKRRFQAKKGNSDMGSLYAKKYHCTSKCANWVNLVMTRKI